MKPLHYQRRDRISYLAYLVYLGAVAGLRYVDVAWIPRVL